MKIIFRTLFLLFFSLNIFADTDPNQLSSTELQKITKSINMIHHYYVESVPNSKLIDSALSGMLSKLDAHSDYLTKDDLKDLDIVVSGKFSGIGTTIVPEDSALRIISPLDDSPAQKAGIKAGDLIIKVDDTLLFNVPANKAINMLRGPKGSNVTVYIIRKGEPKPLKFVITRNIVDVQTVKHKLLENHYGYLRIAIFYQSTNQDLKKAIAALIRQTRSKLYGVIIDVRNNPGGLFNPAVEVADTFLDADKLGNNKTIVYTDGYPNHKKDYYKATRGEMLPKIPIVVIINNGTASAAEIVAGALQDHKRALIVGTKSFGKGSVQTVVPIDRDSAIKITTALYFTPSGNSIQAKGIVPDITLKEYKIGKVSSDNFPLADISESDLQNHLKNGSEATPIEQSTPQDTKLLSEDFQLFEALTILKGLAKKN